MRQLPGSLWATEWSLADSWSWNEAGVEFV
jgi:hypothetical protein